GSFVVMLVRSSGACPLDLPQGREFHRPDGVLVPFPPDCWPVRLMVLYVRSQGRTGGRTTATRLVSASLAAGMGWMSLVGYLRKTLVGTFRRMEFRRPCPECGCSLDNSQ